MLLKSRSSNSATVASLAHRGRRFVRFAKATVGSALLGLGLFAYATGAASSADAADGVLSQIAEWFTDDIMNGRGTSISSDGFGRTTASWSDGHNKFKVRIDGEVVFGDDDRSIRRISNGGRLSIWEKRGSDTRQLRVSVGGGAELEYEYKVNGKETAFDASGEAWLSEVLVDIIRKTGIGAEERANRLLDREGLNGLLEEIQLVENDCVIRMYLATALSRSDLSTDDCASILGEAALEMDSDYEKAELLLSVARHNSWNSSLAEEYVGVASTMESDYEIRRSLASIELNENTEQGVIDVVLQVAARMESDYEVAELLTGLAPSCNGSVRLSQMYVTAASGIESDYEARRALTALNWHRGLSANTVVGALNIAGGLESDYEAAELLIELAPYSANDDRTATAFMTAVRNVDSDYETARSLGEFVESDVLDEPTILAALGAAKSISSSYEQAGVLRKMLRHCRGNGVLEDAYLDALDTVDADYERETLISEYYRGDPEVRRARRGE